MKKSVDISIIIVHFNTPDLLKQCLASIRKSSWGTYSREIIVINNGSPVLIDDEDTTVKYIQNKTNKGFAVANNQGIKASSGRYILLLNSDTEVNNDSIRTMIAFMDTHPDAGVSTCKVVLSDGSLDPACHRGFPTPWAALSYYIGLEKLFPTSALFSQYHQGYKDLNSIHEIDSPSGAFFLVRRVVIEEVGLLDEHFFMYGEDLDWAFRIKKAWWKILYNPAVTVLHKKKQSGRASENLALRKQTQKYFYNTMELFYKKHYAGRYGWLITQLILFGIKFRSLF